MRNKYERRLPLKCKLLSLEMREREYCARIIISSPNVVVTSSIKFIDFEMRVFVTQHNIYKFDWGVDNASG